MKSLAFVLFTLCSITCNAENNSGNSTTQNIILGEVTQISLNSAALQQQRQLMVYLPEHYSTGEKHYPVLYLLDGERHLNHTITAYKLYRELALVPEMLIVAIPNFQAPDARQNDFYHAKQKFREFLKSEVLATINQTYRTNGDNSLYGHSLAGFFTLDLLSQAPELFKRYIAASPPLHSTGKALYRTLLKVEFEAPKVLYITLASPEDEGDNVTSAFNLFLANMNNAMPDNLSFQHDRFNDQTHISNYYVTLFNGS